MKLVKNFLFTAVFVSALSINTFGGDQQTPGFVPPPPPPPDYMRVDRSEVSYDGTSIRENGSGTAETSDYLLYKMFTVLLSLY